MSTKLAALGDVLSVHAAGGKAIVFTKTKMGADEVAAAINRSQVGAARVQAQRLDLGTA